RLVDTSPHLVAQVHVEIAGRLIGAGEHAQPDVVATRRVAEKGQPTERRVLETVACLERTATHRSVESIAAASRQGQERVLADGDVPKARGDGRHRIYAARRV